MHTLQVCGLAIRRNKIAILDQVDWTVRRGEHWVILGANGSGKTSLLSALTGYMTPTAGTVTVLGKTFGRADWPALRRRIGLVSSSIRQMIPNDEPALLTVAGGRYAMIDFWGKLKAEDKRQAHQLLLQVECEALALRTWEALSQGERQRVLIARALMAKPALLILDEPCAGLDPIAREHFLHFVQQLGRSYSGPAIVFVTHHVEEIMPVFNHVLLLRAGRVYASGKKQKVLNSRNLSGAFGAEARLIRASSRYALQVRSSTSHII